MLKFTDELVENKNKKLILINGRVHPGEPQGSYLV